MHVVVEHKVIDREQLAAANPQEINDGGPAGVQGLQTLIAADVSKLFCLWETTSIDALRDYLDPATAGVTENTYFEIDSEHSLGLPAAAAARA
jgi:hypothetical protein